MCQNVSLVLFFSSIVLFCVPIYHKFEGFPLKKTLSLHCLFLKIVSLGFNADKKSWYSSNICFLVTPTSPGPEWSWNAMTCANTVALIFPAWVWPSARHSGVPAGFFCHRLRWIYLKFLFNRYQCFKVYLPSFLSKISI